MENNYRRKEGKSFKRKDEAFSWGSKNSEGNNIETTYSKPSFKQPAKEAQSSDSTFLNSISFKDLQNVGLIEVKADPYVDPSSPSTPYYIINGTNKVVEATYPGDNNILGNTIVEMTNSPKSKFLNCFDVVTGNFRIQYLYANYDKTKTVTAANNAVNIEFTKTMGEAIAVGTSTMTTQLAFFSDKYESNSMPDLTGYVDPQINSMFNAMLHYQTVLQNIVSPIAKYIILRGMEATLINMSYRRETQFITSLYGLLKKSAFIATLNSLATTVAPMYFDDNWYRQCNSIFSQVSRKSNSISDPLISLTATHVVPHLKITANGASKAYYDSDTVLLSSKGNWINPDTWAIEEGKQIKFEELVYRLNRMLDPSTVLRWARMLYTDVESVKTVTSPSAYYENINRLVMELSRLAPVFTGSMTSINTFLDKLSQSKFVYWKPGISIKLNSIATYIPPYNKMLHDILINYLSGPSSVEFDASTRRWKVRSLWNKYTGIAKFDVYSGGAFLTFGLRGVDASSLQGEGTLTPANTNMLVPIMFASEIQSGYNKVIVTSRTGYTEEIIPLSVSTSTLQSTALGRLDIMNTGYNIKIPTVTLSKDEGNAYTFLSMLLTNLFGYGKIIIGSQQSYFIDPDYLCFIDNEIYDISNAMIAFCRNYSPFRVTTPNSTRTMGFVLLK